jgi:glutathionylspermidine synthase
MYLNETYNKVRISINLSKKFTVHNVIKQGDVSSPLTFNVAFKYVIRKVQENQVGLKLNKRHQVLAYDDDDDVKLLGDNIDTVKKSTETLIDA